MDSAREFFMETQSMRMGALMGPAAWNPLSSKGPPNFELKLLFMDRSVIRESSLTLPCLPCLRMQNSCSRMTPNARVQSIPLMIVNLTNDSKAICICCARGL